MGSSSKITPGCVYGAGVLLTHLGELVAEIPGVHQNVDVEPVHRMRVASRRLRNALDLFKDHLPPGKGKKWIKRVARVTRTLGRARDLDVQLQFLKDFSTGLSSAERRVAGPGLDRLQLRLSQERSALQGPLLEMLDWLTAHDVINPAVETLRAYQVQGRVAGVKGDDPTLCVEAAQLLRARLEEVLVYAPYVEDPQNVRELHQMRIAAKHLRYSLEAYAQLLGKDEIQPWIKLARSIQAMLGQIHDDDVWCDFLPRFADQERQRFEEFFGHARGFGRLTRGLDLLLADRRRQRTQLHEEFVLFWKEILAQDQWGRFRDMLAAVERDAGHPMAQPTPTPQDHAEEAAEVLTGH